MFIYITQNTLAQESDILSKIILLNPTTFQFTTYGNLKLNNNTGGLTHSIPIYSIKDKDIEHPISLSYSSNGVSLDKLGGSIGIDCILNTGGTIARIVKDGVDENSLFGKFNDDPFYNGISLDDALAIARKHGVMNSSGGQTIHVPTDTERDWYSFKINELSGNFYRTDEALPGNGQKLDPEAFVIESDQYVKINNARAPFFEITDSKGYRYKFENTESSQTFITSTGENSESDIPTRKYALTGWNLTELISPTGNTLTFEYLKETITYHAGISTQLKVQSQMPFGSMNSNPKITETRTYSNVSSEVNYLSKIRFSGGYVNFSYSKREDRLDKGGLLLKEISVFSRDSLLQKTKLSYSQTESPNRGLTISGYPLPLKHDWKYRYFLEKIIFLNSKDEVVNHYDFEYYNKEKLPSLFNLARDAYGYCNEMYDNTGLFGTRFSEDTLLQKTLPTYILQNY